MEYRFFFFKQKTAYEMRISDWSSDMCSSDLLRHCRKTLQIRPGQFRASVACTKRSTETGQSEYRHACARLQPGRAAGHRAGRRLQQNDDHTLKHENPK